MIILCIITLKRHFHLLFYGLPASLFYLIEKVIDDVRNRVAAYEDSIRHHHEMVEMATYKISKIITPEFSTTASFSVFWN